ncbi:MULTISPECIES: hypothetical protein [Lysobacter]|uniref:DUF3955 domain-containing protein n=1 Tax=Lysobacter soli TaxID=453783 RepID=A0A3D8VGU4_9GAMM|nr:hypothetical protein [Lysobacter soli]MDG2517264.1 hypothetical protein [Lysobacter soli]RDY68630.1 hypothetical protein DX912_03755 [Lysobacter soli]UTA54388.1 hypothetical protein L3D22_00525 [Lysobacter soli]
MKSIRLLAGWLCIVLGFAVMILISFGVFDPIAPAETGTSIVPVLIGMLPSVTFGIALFAIGVWLISSRKR